MMLKRLLFAVLLFCAFAAQATVYSLPWGPKPQFVDANGATMSGGTISTFLATSSTPQATFTDSTGAVQNPTTITLNTRGETPNEVWLSAGVSYKFVLKDSSGSTIWTVDNVSGVNDVAAQVGNEWIASGLTPTFISVTSFSVTGDQTQVLQVGRRLKTTNSGGTIYSTVTASTFAAVTTVTVANDVGTLDSGLSSVSYGLLSAINPSISADMVARKGTAVSSAATTNIWGVVGDYVHVTGTVTITSLGTAPYAGAQRTVIFDGALTLTHNGTSLVLPGALNIQTAANDRMVVRADTTANMVVIAYERASGLPPSGTSLPRSYLAGLTMSTTGGSATMTIAAGQSIDSTNAVVMNLASSINKTTGAFAVGTGNGCLDTGAIANSTWYHFYEVFRSDTLVVDIICSTSASAPTMPASYTHKRRIGSGKTDGAAQWTAFTQDGDYFRWAAGPTLDVNTTNPGTSAVTSTLTVPTGVNVHAIIQVATVRGTAVNPIGYVSDLAATDEAASSSATPLGNMGFDFGSATGVGSAFLTIRTNTSAQVRYRLSASAADTVVRMVALGWLDRRGRDN